FVFRAVSPGSTTFVLYLGLLDELFAGFHEYVKSHEARLEQRLQANRDYQSQMKEQMEKIRKEVLQQVSE
ncbi:MAG: hypothetical protein P5702_26470, partial [Limnospira sp. PMC 1291.21]|nr:hypothetical protein [Limnospira sp. PMC 1238.20]MDT9191166.1 hypothetical protein [Limnospira sp. PMC 894.15]MDT9196338.1 hypothetical protein [Limnospira sp. PMC 1245.20]MDT9201444.1 hypothetical protein [Limnospira sp. PMC 1042.18]MDT9206578.1 hypothetical protein [Limnospira sp. PMC 1243.20]MDT9216793.1 hypothetical protein [Limnospira sp. PMC 1256.20]MDT9221906.1 hypothetical protein [Limnospira sp. PMC 1240.20]MDT9226938.1 hypothetical protein [Limnospira sp. PMC 1279.21]MDT9232008